MRIFFCLSVFLLTLASACSSQPRLTLADMVRSAKCQDPQFQEERDRAWSDLAAFADEAVGLGVPDARGGTFWQGTIRVQGGAFAGDYNGLSLQCADGSWFLQESILIRPSSEVIIDTRLAHSLPPDQVLIETFGLTSGWKPCDPTGQTPVSATKTNDWQLELYAPEDRPRLRDLRCLPLWGRIDLTSKDFAMKILLLTRARVPGWEYLAIPSSFDARGEIQTQNGQSAQCPLQVQTLVLDQREEFVYSEQHFPSGVSDEGYFGRRGRSPFGNIRSDFMPKKPFRFGLPSAALRVGLADYFYSRLALPARHVLITTFSTDQILSACRALVPKTDLKTGIRLDQLAAALALPNTVPVDAPIATRLTTWRVNGLKHQKLDQTMILRHPGWIAQDERSPSSEYLKWKEQVRQDFLPTDLPALMDLIADPRPSRWIEVSRSQWFDTRTIGDNALRAASKILGFDPRFVIGRSVAAPWTDAERAATIPLIQAWWRSQVGATQAEIRIRAATQLPIEHSLGMIDDLPVKERDPILTSLASTLANIKDLSPSSLALLIKIGGHHAAIQTFLNSLPLSGPTRIILADWHDQQGRPEAFDTLCRDLLNPDSETVRNISDLPRNYSVKLVDTARLAYRMILARPNQSRLNLLRDIIAQPLENPTTVHLLSVLLYSHLNPSEVYWTNEIFLPKEGWRLMAYRRYSRDAPDPIRKERQEALALALAWTLVNDTRMIPKNLIKVVSNPQTTSTTYLHIGQNSVWDFDQKPVPDVVPEDWRVCDLASAICGLHWLNNFNIDNTNERQSLIVNLYKNQKKRDKVLANLRERISKEVAIRLQKANF